MTKVTTIVAPVAPVAAVLTEEQAAKVAAMNEAHASVRLRTEEFVSAESSSYGSRGRLAAALNDFWVAAGGDKFWKTGAKKIGPLNECRLALQALSERTGKSNKDADWAAVCGYALRDAQQRGLFGLSAGEGENKEVALGKGAQLEKKGESQEEKDLRLVREYLTNAAKVAARSTNIGVKATAVGIKAALDALAKFEKAKK